MFCCFLALGAQRAGAQDAGELIDLIFEPVLLSVAAESPYDIGGLSEADAAALRGAVDAHQAAVEQLTSDRGRGSELVIQLAELAAAYQDLGLHDAALDTLDDAVSESRSLHGRRGLEQIPLLRQKMRSLRALRDISAIDDTEERIYDLRRRHFEPGSREMYLATVDLTDWLTAAEFWETLDPSGGPARGYQGVSLHMIPCSQDDDGVRVRYRVPSCDFSISPALIDPIVVDTPSLGSNIAFLTLGPTRLSAIDALYGSFQLEQIENGYRDVDIALDLAKRVARLAYTARRRFEFSIDRRAETSRPGVSAEFAETLLDASFVSGERALQYAVDLLSAAGSGGSRELAAAWLNLGDWRLAFGKTTEAEQAYDRAYRIFEDMGFSSEQTDRALASALPPRIPVFATHLFTRRGIGIPEDSELRFRGYVDLGFTIDSAGDVRDLTFLGESAKDATAVESWLRIDLKSAKFRPALAGGKLMSPGRIEARYYYSY